MGDAGRKPAHGADADGQRDGDRGGEQGERDEGGLALGGCGGFGLAFAERFVVELVFGELAGEGVGERLLLGNLENGVFLFVIPGQRDDCGHDVLELGKEALIFGEQAAILVVADEFGVVLEFLFDPGGFLLDAFVDIDLFLGVVADRVRQHPVLQAVKGRRGAVEREHARHGVFVTVVGRPVDLVHLQVGETGEQKQAQRGAGDQHDQPLSDGHGVRSKCRQRCSNHTLEGRACQAQECPWRITFGVFWKAFFVVHSPPGAAGGEVPLKARFWTF